jgi:hypothetical protein
MLIKIVRGYILPWQAANMAGAILLSFVATFLVMSCILITLPFAGAEHSIGRGPDSDSDGLSDSFETRLGSNPAVPDSDRDGLSDAIEYTGGGSGMPSDPTDRDSDNDGLKDDIELITGTDPTMRDTDTDGLSDSLEVGQNANPLNADSDGDGVTDNIEVWHGSDPSNPESFFVLPESPVGAIAKLVKSMAFLGVFMYFRSVQKASAQV